MATQPYCSRPTIQHSAHHTKQPSQWHEGRHRAAQTLLVKVPNIRVHVVTPDTPDRCLTAAQGEDLRARRPITELGPKASVDSQSFLRDCLLAAKTCGELTFHVDGALGRMDSVSGNQQLACALPAQVDHKLASSAAGVHLHRHYSAAPYATISCCSWNQPHHQQSRGAGGFEATCNARTPGSAYQQPFQHQALCCHTYILGLDQEDAL
jgi:hypothetical protein